MIRRPRNTTRTDTPLPYTTLFRAGAAAGADVQAAQAQLVADVLGVLVLVAVDGVAAPADDEVGVGRLQHAGVAQQAEHRVGRSEEPTSELQSLMRNSYAVFCLTKKHTYKVYHTRTQ